MSVHELNNGVSDLDQGRVVRCFENGDMEGKVTFDLRLDIVADKAGIQPVKYPLQIEFIRFRGVEGGNAGTP